MPTEEELQTQAAVSAAPSAEAQKPAAEPLSSDAAVPQTETAAEAVAEQTVQTPEQAPEQAEPADEHMAQPQESAAETTTEQAAQPTAEKESPAARKAQTEDEKPFELVPTSEFKQIVETLLFITDRPLKPGRIADVIDGVDARRVREMILEIQDDYLRRNSAIQVVEVGGGFQMSTKPEYGRWVRRLYNEKMTTKLSNAALETLAIIAYKQPITRAEMEAIRGVDVAGPLERLLERSLVRVVGKKDTVGRPLVYGTTDEFLRMFGLNKVSDLPDLQVFAAKSLHEKQADLPFGEPLPPLAEPGIIPLEELEGEERLEALDSSADPFFKRNSYNKGDFFGEPVAQPDAPAAGDAVPQEQPAQPPHAPAAQPADAAPETAQTPAEPQPQTQDVPQEEK